MPSWIPRVGKWKSSSPGLSPSVARLSILLQSLLFHHKMYSHYNLILLALTAHEKSTQGEWANRARCSIPFLGMDDVASFSNS